MQIKDQYSDYELMQIAMLANNIKDHELQTLIDSHRIASLGFLVPTQAISKGDVRTMLAAIRQHEAIKEVAETNGSIGKG